jgi:hypothetical protein
MNSVLTKQHRLYRMFLEIAKAMADDSLDNDGEFSNEDAQKRQRRLDSDWKYLERQLGRKVTQQEIWALEDKP